MLVEKLGDNTKIKGANVSVSDFWRWAYSDLLSNRNRMRGTEIGKIK